ncbi:Yip1 family protein [Metabacillus malikii]|uniref:Yip1 domain-containing protein n=1 Tax=Metabacillus malikii TaxID=1504265 RepID=A0ABT9ZGH7_9BACI|nr:Yip1 family protein [Metabacillus malikii]MDQ0231359.1 hypothetical protein [Metabacillus malikii]
MENETIQTKKPSLFGMVFSPGEQFERIREKPVIWVPLIILTILGVIIGGLAAFNVDYTQLPNGDQIRGDEAQLAKSFGIGFGIIGTLIAVPIGFLFQAAIYFVASKIAKSAVTFKQMFSTILFASFISTIGSTLNFVIVMLIDGDPAIILTSLNSVVNAEGALGALLGMIEVFAIWYYILLGMGLVKVAKLSKPAAVTIVIIFFILGALFTVGSAQLLEGLNQLQ